MPQADHASITSKPSSHEFTRCAVAMAPDAATVMPPTPSREFRAWLAARAAARAAMAHPDQKAPFGSPALNAAEKLLETADAAQSEAAVAVVNRIVETWQDFAEIVNVVQTECWVRDTKDGTWIHCPHDAFDGALMRAALSLTGGTPMSSAAQAVRSKEYRELSADFRSWHDLAKQYEAALQLPEPSLLKLWAAMEPIEHRIFAQPVRGIVDANVVAEIGMIALFWSIKQSDDPNNNDPFLLGADEELSSVYRDKRSSAHLIQAAARLFLAR